MTEEALAAAEALAADGLSAEVIDLRTLNPLAMETIAQAVARTGRAMVVCEAPVTGGFAAEISAQIMERCFEWLEEPVIRVCGEDAPIPVAPDLERASIPNAALIAETARWMVRRQPPDWAAAHG